MEETLVGELSVEECEILIEELKYWDKNLKKKTEKVIEITGVTIQEALEYLINDNIALWAKMHCSWDARDYQLEILNQGKKAKKLVLRLGRRLGKTETTIIDILWHGVHQPNKRENDTSAYEILILTPFETQIDLIFDRLKQIITASPLLKSLEERSIHHRIDFKNGTIIKGLTVGSSSGKGAANTRGQAAALLVMDEVDYMGSKEITNILNIANEDPARIKIVAASTPSGKHEDFYQWCTGSSVSYTVSDDDVKNFEFNGFIKKTKEKGNGWTEIFAPSLVNKTILEINPETNQTYLEDIRDSLTAIRFEQEVMAEFGDMEMGVYKKVLLDLAYEFGSKIRTKYWDDYKKDERKEFFDNRHTKILLAAIDWDIAQSTPNILCLMYDKLANEKRFEVLFRIDIPRTEYTLTNAMNKLIELNDVFEFDHIAIDRGYGEKICI